MGKSQRDKGRRGQSTAENLLKDHDWSTIPVSAGVHAEDLVAVDPFGTTWSVEVKNCVVISVAHRQQAMAQAKARKLPWMLMSKIAGTGFWLVQRQGMNPVVWFEKSNLL
jgi:hypothetical protein